VGTAREVVRRFLYNLRIWAGGQSASGFLDDAAFWPSLLDLFELILTHVS
jgi:hypothetical protein